MKPLLLLALIASASAAFAQAKQARKDSFVRVSYTFDTTDEVRIREGLLGISTSKYYIPATFSKYYCDLLIEEFYEGEVVSRKSYRDSLGKNFEYVLWVGGRLEKKGFPVLIDSYRIDSTLRLYISLGGLGAGDKLRLHPRISYSWKDVYNLEKKRRPLRPGQSFPLLVYTSPVSFEHSRYKIPGSSEFCDVSGEKIPPENWYKELGIQHFFLFSIHLKE